MVERGDVECGEEIGLEGLGLVLALGEVTGHHHTVLSHPEGYDPTSDLPAGVRLKGSDLTLQEWASGMVDRLQEEQRRCEDLALGEPAARLYRGPGEDRILKVTRPTLLRHEEHPALYLDPGVYRVRVQQEYSPEHGWAMVSD